MALNPPDCSLSSGNLQVSSHGVVAFFRMGKGLINSSNLFLSLTEGQQGTCFALGY